MACLNALVLALLGGPTAHAATVEACVSESEQAIALRKQGKLREAVKHYALCADPSCPNEVSAECAQRIAAIEAAIPTVIFAAKDAAGTDLFDVSVSLDGVPLVARLDGRAVSLDAGPHLLRFETKSGAVVERPIVLLEGEKNRRESVVLVPAVDPRPRPRRRTTQRTIGIVILGVGIVGLGIGAGLGALAIAAKNGEVSACGPGGPAACSDVNTASAKYTTALHDGNGASVAFAAGGAFVITGAVLWLTSPSAPLSPPKSGLRLTPALGNRTGGLSLTGEF